MKIRKQPNYQTVGCFQHPGIPPCYLIKESGVGVMVGMGMIKNWVGVIDGSIVGVSVVSGVGVNVGSIVFVTVGSGRGQIPGSSPVGTNP